MQFSHKWLQSLFEEKIPSAIEVSEKLGLHSFELEGLEEVPETGDFLIDLDILPNRSSDCMSYKGIAGEISALFNIPLKKDVFGFESGDEKVKTRDYISLVVEDSQKVKRATKAIAKNIKIKQSPQWMRELLESIGQKSINNVVDITNYVMWMTGQPVHAFDFDKLDGEEIKEVTIRYAFDGEEVIDLAGTKHVLDNCMLVVADKKKALDIAGVKGGMGSGVDENTKTVMMSAVNFEFTNIRNTSKKLKLRTDASTRFENDVPLCRIDDAINLFSRLLVELAEAEVSKDIIDTNPYEYEKKQSIEISEEKISRVLGTKVGEEKVLKIFNSLGFDTEKKDDVFLVKVPSDRLDLKIREDLIEEVGRVIGYDNLPAEMPEEGFNFPNKSNFKTNFYKTLDILVSEGFYEINSRALSKKGNIELANPYTSELSFVRSNLLGGLEDKVEKEIFNIEDLKVFEIGKVFTDYKTDEEGKIVAENWSFAGIIGKRKIKKKQEEELFFKTKGYLEKVFENIFAKNIVWKKSKDEKFVAEVFWGEEKIGFVGVNFWEINFEMLVKSIDSNVDYKKVSKYPKMDRDVAFFVPTDFSVQEASSLLKSISLESVTEVKLFDIYKVNSEQSAGREGALGCKVNSEQSAGREGALGSKDMENNRKSFAFKIIFQSEDRTLSDEFANEQMEKVYGVLNKNGFEIR